MRGTELLPIEIDTTRRHKSERPSCNRERVASVRVRLPCMLFVFALRLLCVFLLSFSFCFCCLEKQCQKKKQKRLFWIPKVELVIRLRDYFERERTHGGPLIPIERVIDRVAAALDIRKATVTRITKEKFGETGTEDKKLSTPKKRKHKASITDIDSFDTIRNHIIGYYERNEFPTLLKLTKSLMACVA